MSMPLFEACEKGDINRVKSLIEGKCHIKRVNEQGRTALHYCCDNTTIDCARFVLNDELIKKKILDLQDKEGCSALHLACINGNQVMVKYLCEQGANVNLLDHESRSVIHWIAGLAILQKLIDCKVDINGTDEQQRTPLMWAASAGYKNKNLSLFRLEDMDVDIKNNNTIVLRAVDELRLLYKYGADQLHVDKNSLSALHCAACGGHADCIRMLIEYYRCPVEGVDINGWTPLFYSITNNHPSICQLLLDLAANPNHKDQRGRTPSHCAVTEGNLDCLTILMKSSANIWLKNKRGDYPIHEAINTISTNKSRNQTTKTEQIF
ncbi:unnamed protein product, partial [Rotaria socialis]